MPVIFFFSSRRRHTRSKRDWSSDVCSSDLVLLLSIARTSAQSPTAAVKSSATTAASVAALKTPWGEPDLQGIWTDESDTPLQRSPKYANQELFTDAHRAELDRVRAALLGRHDAV